VTSTTTAGRIQALLATDEHADSIAAFYRECWGRDATGQSVRAARRQAATENVVAPGEPPPTAIVLDGDRVIAHCSSIAQRLWDGVAEHPAHWLKGLIVLPEYRQGPIGFLVCKELAAHLPRATVLAVAPAAGRLFRALGYADLGAVANFVRPLRPGTLARRLDITALGLSWPGWLGGAAKAGAALSRLAQRTGVATLLGIGAGAVLDLAAAALRRRAGRFSVAWGAEAPGRDELDDVWRTSRVTLAASPVRDGRYLRSRFGAGYLFATVREAGRLVGVAALRQPSATGDPRLRGVRVATVSDIVFPAQRATVGLAVLGGVERVARAAGADAILCTTSHHALTRLLRRQAYVRLPGNVHFFLHDRTGAARWPHDLRSWWLARGDGDADEVF
jgi:hypothetical protein